MKKRKAYFKMSEWAKVTLTTKYPKHPLAIEGLNEPALSGKAALVFLKKYMK